MPSSRSHQSAEARSCLPGACLTLGDPGVSAWECGGAVRAGDWTSLGLDQGRSRATTERSGPRSEGGNGGTRLPLVVDTINRVLVSSPAVADGFAVFGTTTGDVVALGASGWSRALATFEPAMVCMPRPPSFAARSWCPRSMETSMRCAWPMGSPCGRTTSAASPSRRRRRWVTAWWWPPAFLLES